MHEIIIYGIQKLSFNAYNNYHWTKKKKFKDILIWQVLEATKLKLKGGYSLSFEFTFKGKKIDSTNTFHYVKIIEDVIFKEDKDNLHICTIAKQGKENKVKIIIEKYK